MKYKFSLANIFLQFFIFVMALFITVTQMPSLRQPTKLIVWIIGVFALISLLINLLNYFKNNKE